MSEEDHDREGQSGDTSACAGVGVYQEHGQLEGVWKDYCVIVERLTAARLETAAQP